MRQFMKNFAKNMRQTGLGSEGHNKAPPSEGDVAEVPPLLLFANNAVNKTLPPEFFSARSATPSRVNHAISVLVVFGMLIVNPF